MKNSRKLTHILLDYGIIFFLVLLIAFFSVSATDFFTFKTCITILKQVSINGVIAVGMAVVILSGGIDLSVGSIVAMAAVLFSMMYNAGLPGIAAIVLTVLIGAVFGLLNGFFVNTLNVPALIATLGTSTAIRGGAYLLTGGIPVSGMPKSIMTFAQGTLWVIPYPVLLLAAVFAIGALVLNKTKFGRHVYAVGGNAEASRLSGINITKIRYTAYIISGFTAAIAGMLLVSRTNTGQPAAGEGYEMNAITSVVLGGVSIAGGEGNLWLVTVGILIVGVLNTGMVMMYLDNYTQDVVQGLILIAAVAFANFSQKVKAKTIVVDEK